MSTTCTCDLPPLPDVDASAECTRVADRVIRCLSLDSDLAVCGPCALVIAGDNRAFLAGVS